MILRLPGVPARSDDGEEAVVQQPGLVSTTDPVSQALVALAIVGLFVLLAREAAHRVLVAMVCVALLWLVSDPTPYRLIGFEAATRAIDMNVLLLLAGMMAVVGVLKSTGAFGWAVAGMMRRARGDPMVAASIVAWFTGNPLRVPGQRHDGDLRDADGHWPRPEDAAHAGGAPAADGGGVEHRGDRDAHRRPAQRDDRFRCRDQLSVLPGEPDGPGPRDDGRAAILHPPVLPGRVRGLRAPDTPGPMETWTCPSATRSSSGG